MNNDTIKRLRALAYFTIDDLVRILGISRGSAHVLCSRYVKNGTFIRLKNNFYLLDQAWDRLVPADLFRVANYLQVPSYISFMTALSYYGITTQVQRDYFESASLKRSVAFEARGTAFKYYKLKKELYFGFVKEKGFFIATPEKAFVDSIYLYSFGKYRFDLASIGMGRFDKDMIRGIAKKFPEKTRGVIKRLCGT